jgi:hydrogenase-4 component F
MPTTVLLYLPIALPLGAAAAHAVLGWRRISVGIALASTILAFGCACLLAVTVTRRGPQSAAGGWLHTDALSAWMLLGITAIPVLVCTASHSYLVVADTTRSHARWYGIQLQLFIAAMSTAVVAGNLGVVWVAIEATTIVTAFLVAHHRTRTALEAAWKYVVICSAAIAIAFLGLVLLYFAARHAGLSGDAALNWTALHGHAHALDAAVTRIAVGLALIGFGAKAGLAPLHAWLPDAHSQAPAPISALMSGVLLAVAFYTVLRIKTIADAALGTGYTRTLLLVLALATLMLTAIMLAGQHDYKRMLAYSSMEHMALVALAAAVGTKLAIAALLLHIAGHGLTKTAAFLSAGHILHMHNSTRIAAVRSLATRAPGLAALFGLALLALLGLPPASLFASEIGIARTGIAAGLGWPIAVGYTLALIAFIAITVRGAPMLLGPPPTNPAPTSATATGPHRLSATAAAPIIVALTAVAVLGITLGPLAQLLTAAATIAGTP